MAGTLQDIHFLPIDVTVLNGGRTSRVLVEWHLSPTTQDLRNLYFFIDRGESPHSLQQLNSEGMPAYGLKEYVDVTANLLDQQKVYYYRVRAVEFQEGVPVQSFASNLQTWDGSLDLVGLYIVEENLFFHRDVAGSPTLILKRRREGVRCPQCWDDKMKKVTKSNCTSCYGTGFKGGYYKPIEAWMLFEPDPKQLQVAEWGLLQPNQTTIQFTNYPLLTVDDLILEVRINKLWKVINVSAAEKNRVTTLQIARVSAVNPSDVEYKIPVSEEQRKDMITEFNLRETQREF